MNNNVPDWVHYVAPIAMLLKYLLDFSLTELIKL